MARSAFQWLPGYREALNSGRPESACLEVLEKGWELTGGLGAEWSQALDLSLAAGSVEGCRWLLAQGIPVPRARPGSGLLNAHRRASALSAQMRASRSTGSPGEAVFTRPNGTPCAPMSGKAAERLVNVFFLPPSAPIPPEYLSILANDGHWETLTDVLEKRHVAPWGGARSAAAVKALLCQALTGSTHQAPRKEMRALLNVLLRAPPDRLLVKAADLPAVLLGPLGVPRARAVALSPRQQNHEPLAEAIAVLTDLGFSATQIAESYRRGKVDSLQDDLAVVALRRNVPRVFGLLVDVEPLWSLRSVEGNGRAQQTDVMTWLARRINACADIDRTGREQWWEHAQALGSMEKGQEIMRRRGLANPVAWHRRVDAERWLALHRAARLDHRLEAEQASAVPKRRL